MCFLVKAAASIEVATCKFTCTCHHIQDKQQVRKQLFNIVEFMITGYEGRRKTGILCPNFGVFFLSVLTSLYIVRV